MKIKLINIASFWKCIFSYTKSIRPKQFFIIILGFEFKIEY